MEYKLNKIDTDIRKKIQEQIKTDKIHANEKINIKKDLNKHDKNNRSNYSEKNVQKKYITIDGIKASKDSFKIEAQKVDTLNVENSSGIILDTKK